MADADLAYAATATVTGGGTGTVRGPDGLALTLATPPQLGGRGGDGTNAEQLLAAAYAACFYNALEYVASRRGSALPAGLAVSGEARLAQQDGDAFRLEVGVTVDAPKGADAQRLQPLVDEAAKVWPHAAGRQPQVRVSLG